MGDEVIAGRYRLLEPLGRGAMSAVWEAEDLELARRVAVKMLGPAADPLRFEREARAAAALSHANIVSLYDFGREGGRPFMILELLPGGSLEDRLGDGRPLPDDDAQRIALEVAAGLADAHAHGLVHRDLKPANILFDAEGRAKIADFGIVRVDGGGTLTEAGTVLGTAAYISPEQASGRPAEPASDVYSFGVILFRLLTGRLPFVSKNAMELVRMHRDDSPPSVTDVRPDAPHALAVVAAAALAKNPMHRPRDGAALLAALRGDDTAATQVLRAVTPAAGRPGHSRRWRLGALPLVVAAAALVAGGVALALAVTLGGGGSGSATTSAPGLSLPTVPAAPRSTTTEATTAAATTTAPATTVATTTAPATTTQPLPTPATTTAPVTTTAPSTTTAPGTTTAPPPAPTTTAQSTSTVATTTAPTTTGP
jgi:eukaryotic-like serine/threonine-protein kinase